MRSIILIACLIGAVVAAPNISPRASIVWDQFWSFDDIFIYLNELAIANPTLTFSETLGFTEGEREIRALKISSRGAINGTLTDKPIVFIEAGMSGRDQITPLVAVNLAHELLDHSEDFEELLEAVEFVILPVSNPDGYDYAFTEDRHWVKNRRATLIPGCNGVNIDRNFDYQWLPGLDPCDDEYSGAEPTSDVESQIISQLLRDSYGGRIKLHINLQTPGGQILYPYAFTEESAPDNYQESAAVGVIISEHIEEAFGFQYFVGPYAHTVGLKHGTSLDYSAVMGEVPLTLTWKIRGDADGGYEHEVEDIANIVNEAFVGILAAADYVGRNYGA